MSKVPKLPIEVRNRWKEVYGWTDEQIDKYVLTSPKMLKLFREGVPRMRKYKIIAQVVKSENCAMQLKPGDKYVFTSTGILLPEQCTAVLDLWALAPMLRFIFMVYDRLSEGLDPNDIVFDHVKCADVGIECGGAGEVLFKISCIEEPWSLEDFLNVKYVAKRKKSNS